MNSNKHIYFFTSKDKDILQTCDEIKAQMEPYLNCK